jgi:DHA1 family multidrug resistance protein-like MFS transporter
MRGLRQWFPRDINVAQWQLIGILGAAEFARTALVVVLLPAFATGPLHLSLTLVGLMISAHYAMDTAFRSPAGWLVDRIGPKRVLLAGLVIEVLAMFGAMHSHQAVWLFVFMGLLGVGTASHWPSVVTGTNRLTSASHRGTMMGAVFAGWIAGSGIGPVVTNFVIGNLGSDEGAFGLLIAAQLVALVLAGLIRSRQLDAPSPRGERHASVMSGFRVIWPLRSVLPGMFVQTMVLGLLLPLLQPLTHRVLHLDQVQFAVLLLGAGALTVLLLVPMGRVADRLGIKVPLIGGFWLAGLALLALSAVRDFWLLVLVGGALGLAYALILPSWNAFLARLIPAAQEGLLWGVFMTVEGLGMTVGPAVGAHLFEWSVYAPFILAAAILGLMSVFYWMYPLAEARA